MEVPVIPCDDLWASDDLTLPATVCRHYKSRTKIKDQVSGFSKATEHLLQTASTFRYKRTLGSLLEPVTRSYLGIAFAMMDSFALLETKLVTRWYAATYRKAVL